MTRYKLTYFDAAASRGEECRLALHLAGLPFEDERLSRDQWAARRESTPFGALPVLTVDPAARIVNVTLNGFDLGLPRLDPDD